MIFCSLDITILFKSLNILEPELPITQHTISESISFISNSIIYQYAKYPINIADMISNIKQDTLILLWFLYLLAYARIHPPIEEYIA